MDQHHWVQELFQPVFQLSEEEVANKTADLRLADGTPQTRIQQIYERVKEEFDKDLWNARQKSTQVGDSLLEDDVSRKEDTEEQSPLGDTKTSFADESETEDGEDSKLWDSKEVEVLREVFLRTKSENKNLKVELEVVKDEIENVTQRLRKKEKKLQVRNERAKATKNAFERLQLENGHLKEQVRLMKNRCESLDEELKDLHRCRENLRVEKATERKQFLQAQSEKREMEHALRTIKVQVKTEEKANAEAMKSKYEMEVKHLLGRLEETQISLEKERGEHKQTKRALDHMRYHFSSLPVNAGSAGGDILDDLRIF